jgi:meckelin
MTLKVMLDTAPDKPEAIFVPYLEIEYEEKATEAIFKEETAKFKDVYFISEYTMDDTGFWRLARATFWTLLIILLGLFFVMTAVHARAEALARREGCLGTAAKSIVSLFEAFSTLYFWYLYAMTGWWFVFFKFQQRVYVLLPGLHIQHNFEPYDGMLGTVALAKLLSLAYKIYFEQSQQKIFFIDWEAEKTMHSAGKYGSSGNSIIGRTGVNPWRRLYIANEFNELQGTKHVTTEMILLLFLVVVEGFGYKYLALMESTPSRELSDSPESFPLSFFVITTVIFVLGVGEYILQMLLQLYDPPSYVDFVDLCSVANISVLIFNEAFQGYYIHGKSPMGAADVSSEKLRLNLEAEA